MSSAAEAFVTKVVDGESEMTDLRAAAKEFLATTAGLSAQEKERALRHISQYLNITDAPRAALVGLVCGALVEQGCDAGLIADPLIERLESLLRSSATLCKA